MSAQVTGAAAERATIEQLLEAKFAPPAWAIFFEVPPATGGPGDRRADAVAAVVRELEVDRTVLRREFPEVRS